MLARSNGVMALMDQMVNDLKSDMTESKHAEETAQADYERPWDRLSGALGFAVVRVGKFLRVVARGCWFLPVGLMKASQETRAANADSITQKEADKASWAEKIENAKEEQLSSLDALEKVPAGWGQD